MECPKNGTPFQTWNAVPKEMNSGWIQKWAIDISISILQALYIYLYLYLYHTHETGKLASFMPISIRISIPLKQPYNCKNGCKTTRTYRTNLRLDAGIGM